MGRRFVTWELAVVGLAVAAYFAMGVVMALSDFWG